MPVICSLYLDPYDGSTESSLSYNTSGRCAFKWKTNIYNKFSSQKLI